MRTPRGTPPAPGEITPARRRTSPWRLVGPAFVAAIAYVDPGNVATNTAAGSAHGYLLLWVVVLATVMAGPVQYLSARLGVVGRVSLPEYVATNAPNRATRLGYWAQAEVVAIATDVAEVIGAAVGLHLLFGIGLVPAGLLAGAASMLLLVVRDRWGGRSFEVICAVSLLVIGGCFAFGIAHVPPSPVELAAGLFPRLDGAETVLLAAGIVGATVMPHAIYLHSSLTATPGPPGVSQRQRLRATRWDVAVAMVVAGTVNISMLVLGATVLAGEGDLGLSGAAAGIMDKAGSAAGIAFAIALLVSGLTSTAVGTQAGAAIMSGMLRRQVPRLVRRLVTVVPAVALLGTGAEPLEVLVLSQVVLALGLPFALVPLVRASFVHRPVEGGRGVAWVGVGVVAVVVALDLALIVLTV